MSARIAPDRAALEVAHRILHPSLSLEAMLEHKAFRLILENVARRHLQRRAQRDVKRLQANDND